MSINKTDKKHFSIGPIVPIIGLDGETIIASKKLIAALSAAEAALWNGSVIKKVELPFVTVKHARWSDDKTKIFIGTGAIDTVHEKWVPNPKLSEFIHRNAYGTAGTRIKAISWNKDGTYVAVLFDWTDLVNQDTESAKLLFFDLESDTPPVTIPETPVSDVRIVGNHIVVLAEQISVWNFKGEEVKRFSRTTGVPFRITVSENENYFILMDNDWSARIIDSGNWKVIDIWKGNFRDIVPLKEGLIALNLEGKLHAACISNGKLNAVGTVPTGLSASQIAATGDGRIIVMGMDSISVHLITYILDCDIKN